jgi:hypothetical protein
MKSSTPKISCIIDSATLNAIAPNNAAAPANKKQIAAKRDSIIAHLISLGLLHGGEAKGQNQATERLHCDLTHGWREGIRHRPGGSERERSESATSF